MPSKPRNPTLRLGLVACAIAALSGCAGGGGRAFHPAEGPFLSPGPLPGASSGTLRASPALPALATGRPGATVPAAVPGMPVGLTAGDGTSALPGGSMPGIGPVHGLVIPVSLGPRTPLRDDAALTRDYFGTAPGGAAGPTLVEQMEGISGGLFRPSFEVLPTLVDSRRDLLPTNPVPRDLMEFAQAVVRSAAARTDLSRFDDDGPDGIPASRDDDGRLDFVVLVVESDEAFPSVTLRQDFEIPTPSGPILSGPIHVLSMSRSEVADVRPAVGLWLDGLGLDPGERFFPSSLPRGISSLARARLGWLPVRPVLAPGIVAVPEGKGVLFPLQDLAAGAGFWLVERDSGSVYVSRVARKADGHFFATEAHCLRPGEQQVLPLTRQFGERGSRVVLKWAEGGAPEAELVSVATRAPDPVPLRRVPSR
jgi:hypothetical protein